MSDLESLYPFTRATYLFAIAFLLAILEIQIEGKHGWAERLPTWRWDSPLIRKWAGKPITGYHVCLVSLILLFVHLPVFEGRWTWTKEAETLSFFFLLAVFWDFLWFVCNPHYGWSKFRAGEVWWFPKWWGRFPVPYYYSVAISGVLWTAPALSFERARTWGLVAVHFAVLTSAVAAGIWWAVRHDKASNPS